MNRFQIKMEQLQNLFNNKFHRLTSLPEKYLNFILTTNGKMHIFQESDETKKVHLPTREDALLKFASEKQSISSLH